MNTLKALRNSKPRAQAIMEFALALPILLLILYGTMEAGRLLFIYGSTVTAARQAVRYGSATGIGPNGPYFNDCTGIDAAARRVGFINVFDTVTISYDRGLDTSGDPVQIDGAFPACPTGADTLINGDRIRVTVTAQWEPIVPIVPFDPFTITSSSERTILRSVDIVVPVAQSTFAAGGTGCSKLVSVAATVISPGVLSYTYSLTNIKAAPLVPVVVDNNATGISCPASVAASASFTCTGTHTATQAELDAGVVTNTTYSTPLCSGLTLAANTIVTTTLVDQNPAISLEKTPSVSATSIVGTVVGYVYKITNSGNVTLTAPFSVTDDKIANVDCSGAASTLAPGAFTTCTASYTIQPIDITNKQVVNNATASNTFVDRDGNDQNITASASAVVYTPPIFLTIVPSAPEATAPGQVITYTYNIKNLLSTPVTSPSVVDDKISVDCSGASASIAAGATTQCTGSYTVTQADMDSGAPIVNTATATAISDGAPGTSNAVTLTVPIQQIEAISIASITSTSNATPTVTGSKIAYTYTLQNSGNVTLNTLAVTDTLGNVITCADQSNFLPNTTRDCTSPGYTVKSTDVSAGSITNTATATAKFGSDPISPSTPVTDIEIIFAGARLSLGITADKSVITVLGEVITYTYTFTNTGGVTLTSPYTVTTNAGSPVSPLDCSLAAASIGPGTSTTCKSTFTTTAAGTITNTVTAATAQNSGSPVSATTINPPSAVTSVYICTGTNLKFATTQPSVGSGDTSVWTITNTVGVNLPISDIQITWDNSGTGGSNYQLETVTVTNSTVNGTGTVSDSFSPFISGTGTLTNNVTTTIAMKFSKIKPTGINVLVNFASPYNGVCHLP